MKTDPYLESRVLTADPMELVRMIYQHALDMVRDGRRFLANGDIAERSKALCRAMNALSELDKSLDHNRGGEISQNLARLYQYMRTRLTVGNMNQADAPLAEVEELLTTLAEAWNGASSQLAPEAAAAAPAPANFNWGMAAGTDSEYSAHSWNA